MCIRDRIKIVGNAKTLQMIGGYYGIEADTVEIREGESLSLGNRTLTFYMAPMLVRLPRKKQTGWA